MYGMIYGASGDFHGGVERFSSIAMRCLTIAYRLLTIWQPDFNELHVAKFYGNYRYGTVLFVVFFF